MEAILAPRVIIGNVRAYIDGCLKPFFIMVTSSHNMCVIGRIRIIVAELINKITAFDYNSPNTRSDRTIRIHSSSLPMFPSTY